MNLVENYMKMASSLIDILGIDIYQYGKEFENTYMRMSDKYEKIMEENVIFDTIYIFNELLDSIVDIIYYICDYTNTVNHGHELGFVANIDDVFLFDENKYPNFKYFMSTVGDFTIKACDDYQFFNNEFRSVARDHINNMIVSEIFEFVSFMNIFYSIMTYENDFEMFEHCIFFIEKYKQKDTDEKYQDVYDIIDNILKTILYDDIVFGDNIYLLDIINPLFEIVHNKNMLKIFKEDDRFHFGIGVNKKKVEKPTHWNVEVDNNPKYNIKNNTFFSNTISNYIEGIDNNKLHECVNNV